MQSARFEVSRMLKQTGSVLHELARATGPEVNEPSFDDNVTRHLPCSEFMNRFNLITINRRFSRSRFPKATLIGKSGTLRQTGPKPALSTAMR